MISMSIDPERERELWHLCSEGDIEAREELIVSYRPLVFWIAGKIHVTDQALKQDIVQEGMLALNILKNILPVFAVMIAHSKNTHAIIA